MQDEKMLERAREGELTEKEQEDVRGIIFGALPKLDETTDKGSIERALNQPSPRGRENYERKLLSEGARRALREPDTTTSYSYFSSSLRSASFSVILCV